MNYRALGVLFWACLIGTAALAGTERQTRVEIVLDDANPGERTFVFDSEEAGFDLHSMAVGETRTLTDKSGNTADVRRTVDGFEFDVDGETISVDDMPDVDGMHGAHGMHEVEMHVGDTGPNVETVRKVKMIKTGNADGVTVISGRQIDTQTRARIEEALQAGGHGGEVRYLDGSELDDDGDKLGDRKREVRIIRKEVAATN